MPFGRLHEEAASDSRLQNLSNAAWRMWAMGLIYCQRNLTDGFIPRNALKLLGVKSSHLDRLAQELCTSTVPKKAPLWSEICGVDGGFLVHDYLQWNDSKEVIQAKKKAAAARIAKWRARKEAEEKAAAIATRNALLAAPPVLKSGSGLNGSRNAFANGRDVVRGRGTYVRKKEKGVPDDKPPEVEVVVDAFRAAWRTAYGHDCSLLVSPLEFMKLEQQAANCTVPKLLLAVAAYFVTSDTYVRKAKHPFGLFLRDPMKYLATEAPPPPQRPPGCHHKPACGDAVAHSQRFLAEQNTL